MLLVRVLPWSSMLGENVHLRPCKVRWTRLHRDCNHLFVCPLPSFSRRDHVAASFSFLSQLRSSTVTVLAVASRTQLVDLSGRVVDTLTGVPVGVVICSSDGTFVASNVLPGHGKIERDWGPRQDLAARATWLLYERSLPASCALASLLPVGCAVGAPCLDSRCSEVRLGRS